MSQSPVTASVSLHSSTVRIYLAHGASGNIDTVRPWTNALRQLGLDAQPVALPKGSAERAVPVYLDLLDRDARATGRDPSADLVIGGHSFGGRVASLVAAEQQMRGLILLSYPLHRPGHPEQLRVDHWPAIGCPVLLLSGESDPFARIDLLRKHVMGLPNAELFTYPGVGHGLTKVMDDAVDRIVEFLS
jgi:predicted alpha/beta-hydrolase family hydrolase